MEKIPIFRLNICPLPGELVPLHIFEERYQALLNHCLKSQKNNLFGIGAHEAINSIGSLIRVEEVLERFPDGRSTVVCVTVGRYRLIGAETLARGGFPLGSIQELVDREGEPSKLLLEECKTLFDELVKFRGIPPVVPDREMPVTAFLMAVISGLETQDRILLLSRTSEKERLETLRSLLSFELAIKNASASGEVIEQ